MNNEFNLQCPVPFDPKDSVQMAHGGGGQLSHQLIESIFLPLFSNPSLLARHDGAVFEAGGKRLAFTTDSYVVSPLFFPGGDIGKLAVCGTVNDLAMCGARPVALSAGFILEEGLPMETLRLVASSMAQAAKDAGVPLVTGDTKVVDKGKGDGLYINTAGIGLLEHGLDIAPASLKDGDAVIVSGDLGHHGTAILAVREGLKFETTIQTDCQGLWGAVEKLLKAGLDVHCLRDLTRGGLTAALNEIAQGAGLSIHIEESKVPVQEEVKGACEMLGLDPLYVANEGKLVAIVAPEAADAVLDAMRGHPLGRRAEIIGTVTEEHSGMVVLRTAFGTTRVVDMLSGGQLPRIC
jgi:hydrogenase expression/formation protein HypE